MFIVSEKRVAEEGCGIDDDKREKKDLESSESGCVFRSVEQIKNESAQEQSAGDERNGDESD